MNPILIEALPAALEWKNTPTAYQVTCPDSLTIKSAAKTDWFIDPIDPAWNCDTAPCAFFTPKDECFIVSAKVHVPFASTFDAGDIQFWLGETLWGKLCFEYSPQGQPMIVSVVTHGKSDDCNSTVINGNEVYLRATVTKTFIAFHYSTDGKFWNMVRLFTLGDNTGIRCGFSAQSPMGEGCEVTFTEISYRAGSLKDYRSGE